MSLAVAAAAKSRCDFLCFFSHFYVSLKGIVQLPGSVTTNRHYFAWYLRKPEGSACTILWFSSSCALVVIPLHIILVLSSVLCWVDFLSWSQNRTITIGGLSNFLNFILFCFIFGRVLRAHLISASGVSQFFNRWQGFDAFAVGNIIVSRQVIAPYTVFKQMSDQNYSISTPYQRKKTQLCHVNFLKPYHAHESSTQYGSADGGSAIGLHPLCVVSVTQCKLLMTDF